MQHEIMCSSYEIGKMMLKEGVNAKAVCTIQYHLFYIQPRKQS